MRRSAAAAFALAIAGTGVPALAQFLVTETFTNNTDTYWDHLNNRTAPQNYGWSAADLTGTSVPPLGGTASGGGELGGALARSSSPANFYAFNLTDQGSGAGLSISQPFEARGVVHLQAPDGGSGFYIGFSRGADSYSAGGSDASNFVGLLFDDGRDVWVNIFDIFGSRDRADVVTGSNPDMIAGNTYAFSMAWTPAPAGANEKGKLDVNFNGTVLSKSYTGDLNFLDFSHFGIMPVAANGGTSTAWFDDLTFTSLRDIPNSPPPPPPPAGSTWAINNHGDFFAAANWTGGGVPNAVGAIANFGGIIDQPRLVFANSNATLGTINFDDPSTYLIAGLGTLTINDPAGAHVNVLQGSHKINLPVVVASNTTLDVSTGATLRVSDPVTINSGVNVTQTGGGQVLYESTIDVGPSASIQFGNSSHMASLTLGSGASAVVTPGVNKVMRIDNLSVAAGKMDLKDNKLITNKPVGTFSGGAYNGVHGDVASAYNFGAWDGNGLMTSMPDAGPLVGTTTIGVADASTVLFIAPTETGVFAGQTVTGATALAVYTYAGDMNFDGLVDAADYGVIDNWVQFPGTSGYANGDLNYDGVIDAGDYGIIDNTIQLQGAPIPMNGSAIPSAELAGVSAVPEPASLSVLGIAAAGLLGRRRRTVR